MQEAQKDFINLFPNQTNHFLLLWYRRFDKFPSPGFSRSLSSSRGRRKTKDHWGLVLAGVDLFCCAGRQMSAVSGWSLSCKLYISQTAGHYTGLYPANYFYLKGEKGTTDTGCCPPKYLIRVVPHLSLSDQLCQGLEVCYFDSSSTESRSSNHLISDREDLLCPLFSWQ